MFDKEFYEFWGEPISVYTDADAIDDGTLTDVSVYDVEFNSRKINRVTNGVFSLLKFGELDGLVVKNHLQFIADHAEKDREGADAWGIFAPDARLGNEKLWLVNNEVGGYTLMLPSEY